jgi:hypothetical protein
MFEEFRNNVSEAAAHLLKGEGADEVLTVIIVFRTLDSSTAVGHGSGYLAPQR